MNDPAKERERAERDPIGHGEYGSDALDEVTVPVTDPVAEAKRRDVADPADVHVDAEDLRDGGPTRSKGAVTTTGGVAGRAPWNPDDEPKEDAGEAPRKIAPTTTGDATSGGMGTPVGGATSDSTTGATSAGDFTDE